jgi:hypothetical protein
MTIGAGAETADKSPSRVAIVWACAIFSTLSVYLAWKSASDLEADATTHYLISRFAFKEPAYFTSVWGRPLCTATYALAAQFSTVDGGRFLARLTSLALALVCAGFTYSIAKRQGISRPALGLILLLGQPLFFLHSFSEMTEIPFATLLMLGFLAYQRRWWLVMAICVAFLPLGRPEGLAFIGMAALALIAHRQWQWLLVLPIPFLIWNFAGWYLTESTLHLHYHWWTWVVRNNPYSYQSVYGRGPWYSFIVRLPVLTSPGFFPFMLVGLALAWKAFRGHGWHLDHIQACEILIALIPLSMLFVHSVLWWKGKMGSNGELRYLLIVGPFFALLGARGWDWTWHRLHWRWPLAIAGVVALLPASINFVYRMVPFPIYNEGLVSRQLAQWYRSDPKLDHDFPRIMPTLPQIFYFMDIDMGDRSKTIPSCRQNVQHPPMGAVLVWDPIYGTHNASADMCVSQEMIEANGWVPYRQFVVGDKFCNVYLSPQTMQGELTKKLYPASDISDWEIEE